LSSDGRTDGHGETTLPPSNFVAGGINIAKSGVFSEIRRNKPRLYYINNYVSVIGN
jgi:hypothetical protein